MVETSDSGLLATGAVVVDVARELLVATGADRVRFLQGIVTGNIAGTGVGAGCHAALLTTKAHVVAEMWAFPRESDLYLAVPAGEGATVAQALSRYAIMDDFAVAPRADFSFIGLFGPQSAARLTDVGSAPHGLEARRLWSHSDLPGPGGGGLWLARAHQLGVDGYWIGGPSAVVGELADALGKHGVRRLSAPIAEASRIAAGEPAWGREISGDYFPMEVGLDDAIDYTKGCFLGQEPIVRIRDRGHVNWRLVRLDLPAPSDSAPGGYAPAPGDRLETDAKPKAGRLTSVARFADGRGVALALAHVSVVAGQQVRVQAANGDGTALATVAP
jgi:folate-binding protein YgfZ